MSGFVKWRRSIVDSPCWNMGLACKVLATELITRVWWQDGQAWDGARLVDVPRGSILTTRKELCDWTSLSDRQVRTALANLEKVGFLDQRVDQRGRLITVRKYDVIEDDRPTGRPTGRPKADQGPTNLSLLEKKNKKGAKTKKSKSVPLPKDWTPTPSHIELARSLGVNCTHEAAKFRDWALAKDERKVRWDAAFSGWLRRSSEYRNGKPAPPKPEEKSLSEKMRERGML